MCRIALTLWFTITALLGPGVCCCTFGKASDGGQPQSSADRDTPASKPARSCCPHGEQPAPCGDHDKPSPSPGKRCPCEHGQHLQSLPASGQADPLSADSLKMLTERLGDVLAPFTVDLISTALGHPVFPPPLSRLSGRDLLAVYSLLRC